MNQRRAPRNETRNFLQRHTKVLLAVAAIITAVVVAVGIRAGYRYQNNWTGFRDYSSTTDTGGRFERGKTLWDWMDLLIFPVVLAGGALWFDRRAAARDREKEETRYQQDKAREETRYQHETLQEYLDAMTELTLEKQLKENLRKRGNEQKQARGAASEEGAEVTRAEDSPVIDVARARTITALRRLKDPQRRNELLDFLGDAALYSGEDALLQSAKMARVNLTDTDLRGINLANSDLSLSYLQKANLNQADLKEAILSYAHLQEADLLQADLQKAKLVEANLQGATLRKAKLQGANLLRSNLQGVKLFEAQLDETTVLPDLTLWTPDTDMRKFTDHTYANFWRPRPGETWWYPEEGETSDEKN